MKYQLIDLLVTQKDWRYSAFVPEQSELAGAQVFCIDNVDNFFWSNFEKYKDLYGFPNVAPPFDNYFMYCDETERTNDDGSRYRDLYPSYRYGLWFLAAPIMDCPDIAIDWFADNGTNRLKLRNEGAKWSVLFAAFSSYNKREAISHAWGQYVVNEDGSINELGTEIKCSSSLVSAMSQRYSFSEEECAENVFNAASVELAACWLATSLLHCKNVVHVDQAPNAKQAFRAREFQKKTGKPAAKWKVLKIEPMVRVLREEGGLEGNGITQALHICRGHFKDYSQGKGLFGRAKGLYWWDQHMRGNESAGVVIKDYKVAPGASAVNP